MKSGRGVILLKKRSRFFLISGKEPKSVYPGKGGSEVADEAVIQIDEAEKREDG